MKPFHGTNIRGIVAWLKLRQAKKRPDPNWQVTVQREQVLDDGFNSPTLVPGYVQVNDVTGGVNHWSKGAAQLEREGYDVPDFARLPTGRYKWAEAVALLKQQSPGAFLDSRS